MTESSSDSQQAINVAVIGRPNVGKSTLINRIIGKRSAIVQSSPGVTRDRVSYPATWVGHQFNLIDTGGWKSRTQGIEQDVIYQTELAIASSQVLLLVVDAQVGITRDDQKIVELIRRAQKPTLVVANKVDNAQIEWESAQFYALGLGNPHPISALHGRDIGDFLDALVGLFEQIDFSDSDNDLPKIAIVGRPNVGKSTLFNYFAQSKRSVVHNLAGTTRDSIDQVMEIDGEKYWLIDTAGLKRRPKTGSDLEYYSSLRTKDAIFRCDIALVLFDATMEITGQDLQIVYQVIASGKALVILLNKYDLLDQQAKTKLKREIALKLANLTWIPILRISAETGWHANRVFDAVLESLTNWRFRISTHQLNRFFERLTQAHPHPLRSGKQSKIQYVTQSATGPPKFVLFTNGPLEPQYLRFIEHQLRENYPFTGTPVQLLVKVKVRR
jgi:GTP-binding protein